MAVHWRAEDLAKPKKCYDSVRKQYRPYGGRLPDMPVTARGRRRRARKHGGAANVESPASIAQQAAAQNG